MKKYEFNLEAVLSHRKMLEELEEQKLTKIFHAIQELEDLQRQMQQDAGEGRKRLHRPLPGVLDVDEMQQLAAYLIKLDQEIRQSALLRAHLEEDRRRQSDKLIEARKRREILEKLKEKSFANYQFELKGMEQKLLDELVNARFGKDDEHNLPGASKNS
jgi:flagellar FliJ protein